ncbi:aldo/keto reductase [Amycolatopsis acidicola]|uniref:Aldo/keto reductase n=1 Tax=Amycolatopsis acidicola TaxID=2596893 RepID=A0A5N0V2L7_9PSEU|nr:aldo/keto reductase [Amycolatopsis acidicola]KAA9157621.1 aldo/keto reductase [Amycolatopsis acidicola]
MTGLAFGCGPIGGAGSRHHDEALATLIAAWEGGVRWFDTAPSYGDGRGERLLGQALRRWPREGIRVSTKVGRVRMAIADPYTEPDGPRREPLFDFTAAGVRKSVLRSLRRLGVERLDTVLVHDPDAHLRVVLDETFPELLRLREEGLVGAIGVGTTSVETARALLERVDVVMIAGAWSLTRRDALPLLDECLAAGVDVLAAAPFDSGLLAADEPDATARYLYRAVSPEVLGRVRELARVCRAHGVRLPQAALAFPLRHPAVRQVVAGMRCRDEVHQNLGLLAEPVPEALWAELDAVAG